MDSNKDYGEMIRERFAQLPMVVQNAITSADVSAHMRQLAETHKLHLDQWGSLENEVQLTLLGVEPAENLAKNIEKEVGVDASTAASLAGGIFKTVFEPIRQQLELELAHPDSVAAHDTTAPAQETSAPVAPPAQLVTPVSIPEVVPPSEPSPVAPQPVLPATPPSAPVEGKAVRAPISSSYAASQASHERKSIEGDPYREQIA